MQLPEIKAENLNSPPEIEIFGSTRRALVQAVSDLVIADCRREKPRIPAIKRASFKIESIHGYRGVSNAECLLTETVAKIAR